MTFFHVIISQAYPQIAETIEGTCAKMSVSCHCARSRQYCFGNVTFLMKGAAC